MKPPQGTPRPAPPDDSPFAVLSHRLQTRLRAEFPDAFAGIVRVGDAFEVYSTGDPGLATAVERLQAEVSREISVRVVTGMTNSLATLERLQENVLARVDELRARGIVLSEFGVDVRSNRLRIGVIDPTPEKASVLRTMFGADQVDVVKGGLWVGV
jgi:hypothetical protein